MKKKNDYLEQINNLFSNNTKKLGDKLEVVTQNIDESEKIKNLIEKYLEKSWGSESNSKDKSDLHKIFIGKCFNYINSFINISINLRSYFVSSINNTK